jgi:hypothetical protein
MSYITKMCLRMMGWCLLPIFFAALVAWPMSAVLEGGRPILPDLPWLVVSTGAATTLVLLVYQSIRVWRWEHGKGDGCFVCGCLLGRERSGRWGPYRKCLGCGKNHSLQNGIS